MVFEGQDHIETWWPTQSRRQGMVSPAVCNGPPMTVDVDALPRDWSGRYARTMTALTLETYWHCVSPMRRAQCHDR